MDIPEASISQISDLFINGRVAVFAGAGLSVAPPSFNPDLNTYRAMILRALLNTIEEKSALDKEHVNGFHKLIADLQPGSARRLKPEVFMELLHSQIGDVALNVLPILEKGSYNDNHLFLAQADKRGHLRIVITTNFDQYIEKALIAEGVPHQVLSHPSDFSQAVTMDVNELLKSVTVVKLHGSIEKKDTIRITLRQAARPLEQDKATLLKNIMARFSVLFYGYSANDDDIHPVLYNLRNYASGIIWSLWDEYSLTSEVKSLLVAYASMASVVFQSRTSLFRKLWLALAYPAGHDVATLSQSHSEKERGVKEKTDQITLNEWADLIDIPDVLHVLGATSRSVSNLQLAKEAFWKELGIFQANKSWIKFANANLSLAELVEMEGDFNSPFQCYLENQYIAEKLEDLGGLAIAKGKMARLQLYLHNPYQRANHTQGGPRRRDTVCSGSRSEELRVSRTSPLDTPVADIGAEIVFRRLGPKPAVRSSGHRLASPSRLM